MHVGPTNSGKTHNALQSLEKAKSGIYCGPLRLLAHEIFDRMNNKSIPCNLVTGEERRELKGCDVRLTSSTIEMANLNNSLDVAVIDEIQMISDQQRGWAWTQALLGLQAKEIHLCGEASAVKLVKSICASLNEDVEVREYSRLSKLVVADESLNGDLRKIQKGDCVVTFSRKAIFGLKNEIEGVTGLRCAVVYGALPPGKKKKIYLLISMNSKFLIFNYYTDFYSKKKFAIIIIKKLEQCKLNCSMILIVDMMF